MRDSKCIVAFATAAAVTALIVAGCKYSNSYPPLPTPGGGAPTFAPGIVTEYPLVASPNATPLGIVKGSDGNMYFTEFNSNKIGRATASGGIAEVAVPTASSLPADIVQGNNANQIWFVEGGSSKIGLLSESTFTISAEFPTTTANAGPSGLKVDPATGNLWFGEFNAGQIGKITPSGVVTEYNVAATLPGAKPDDVAITSDGRIWFLDFGRNGVGWLTFPGPTINEVAIPSAASAPEFMTVGPDGNVWFTEGQTGFVGVVSVSVSPPSITEFVPPTSTQIQTVPLGITTSPEDNDIWFAETNAGQVGRITPSGSITEWGIPGTGTTAIDVAPGPDSIGGASNDLWFTDGGLLGLPIGTNQVGKINLAAVPALTVNKSLTAKQAHRLPKIPIHFRMR